MKLDIIIPISIELKQALSDQKWSPIHGAFQISSNGLYSRHTKWDIQVKNVPMIHAEILRCYSMRPIAESFDYMYYSR